MASFRRPVPPVTMTIVILLALLGMASPHASAGEAVVRAAGGTFAVPTVSLREARFQTVIRQQYDFSCGSAALATLLHYHYGMPTNEEAIFRNMYENGDQAVIRQAGFSLLDMRSFLARVGLRADGYEVTLDKLTELSVPAIVLINTKGYRHFVVIKGIRGDEILVGDPALGTRVYDREDFEAIWQGISFMIRDKLEVAHANFNKDEDWAVRAKAPFGTALSRQGLSTLSLHLPVLSEF